MAEPKTLTQINLTVPLDDQCMKFLNDAAERKGEQPSLMLSKWMVYWLQNQSAGGLLLNPADVKYLNKLNGDTPFTSSQQITKAVEKALERVDGQYTFMVNLDPSDIEPAKEAALACGRSVQEMLNEALQTMLGNGWLYEWTPNEGKQVPVDSDRNAVIARVLGKNDYTSEDIAKAMVELEGLRPKTKAKAA